MDPFSYLANFTQTALSAVGDILNFNSQTNQPAQPIQRGGSTRRNTPRSPHSTILRPQKPQASADEEESSKSAKNQNYGSLRAERSLKEEGARTRADKSYLGLNLDAPPPDTVIELYRQSHIVPSGRVFEERTIEQQRVSEAVVNSELKKIAEKQGSEFPDRVYKGPGRY